MEELQRRAEEAEKRGRESRRAKRREEGALRSAEESAERPRERRREKSRRESEGEGEDEGRRRRGQEERAASEAAVMHLLGLEHEMQAALADVEAAPGRMVSDLEAAADRAEAQLLILHLEARVHAPALPAPLPPRSSACALPHLLPSLAFSRLLSFPPSSPVRSLTPYANSERSIQNPRPESSKSVASHHERLKPP